MSRGKKIFIGVSVSLIVMISVVIVLSYVVLHRPIPDYDGERSVRGIVSPVKIYRDSSAVPYIVAENETDAAYALGYVHAQERFFQMDLERRAGEGRLSEIFGSKTVPFDKMFRTLGLYRNAKRDYEKLSPLSKKMLEAYTRGVNEYLKEAKGKCSVEFDILGYTPYQWKPEHSIVIAKLMAWELNISWWTDIAFTHLAQKLGEEKVKEILPSFPENAPTIIPKGISGYSKVTDDFIKTDQEFRKFMGFTGTHIGSNNWVVDGKKSATGKPIIANDPHLAFQAPGKWYLAVIKSKDWNTAGFTLPGLPAVVIGKNENISWVMTNVMADDADFYSEQLDSTGTKYLVDGNWNKLQVIHDSIKVKDSSAVSFTEMYTHHGPIISGIHPYNVLYPNSEQNKGTISMRWTALDFSDELFAILSVNKAANWNQFKEALRYYTVPGQNFVYADRQGNIGYVCAAKLPIRNTPGSSFVYDGTKSFYDWKGFVPYEEMPKLFNPSQDFIASANNKTVENFKYHISNLWEPSSRIQRITELLTSKQTHSVKDFEKYQMDFYSYYAKELTGYILNAFNGVKVTDKNLNLALELLRKWDYQMNAESQTPTIYAEFLQKLIKNIFEDEMGPDLLKEYVFVANVPYRVILQLMEGNSSSWFDNINTPGIETRDDIIRSSLADALSGLENNYGKNLALWQWGEIHKVVFKHFFHGVSGILDDIVDIGPYDIGGDGTTIFNTEYSFNHPFENTLGPSMRYIYDFSKPDEFEFILPTGESGHIFSPHYDDMTDKWLNGRYIKIKTGINSIQNSDMDLLTLLPD